MVRGALYLEIMEREDLVRNAETIGTELASGLEEIANRRGSVSNVRAQGLWQAFTMESTEARDAFRTQALDAGVLTLTSGADSVRLRPPLTLTSEEAAEAIAIFDQVIVKQESTAIA